MGKVNVGVESHVADMSDVVSTLHCAFVYAETGIFPNLPKRASLALSACRLCFSSCDYCILAPRASVHMHSKMCIAKSLLTTTTNYTRKPLLQICTTNAVLLAK